MSRTPPAVKAGPSSVPPSLAGIRAALAGGEAKEQTAWARASVAIILRESPAGVETLMIERAHRDGDPWSGQMAFPGGRRDPEDEHDEATAVRETAEELALDLGASERLSRLHDLSGSRAGRNLVIAGFVFAWEGEDPALVPNHEVAAALWVPLRELLSPSRAICYRYSMAPATGFPAVQLDFDRVVWGLTYRFLEDLFGRLGHRLPRAREDGSSPVSEEPRMTPTPMTAPGHDCPDDDCPDVDGPGNDGPEESS